MSSNRWAGVFASCVLASGLAARGNVITNGGFDTIRLSTGNSIADDRFIGASGGSLTNQPIRDGTTAAILTAEGNATAASWSVENAAFTASSNNGGTVFRSADYTTGPTNPGNVPGVGGFISVISTGSLANSAVLYQQLASPLVANTPFQLTVEVFDRNVVVSGSDVIGLPATLMIQLRYGASINGSTLMSATLTGSLPPNGGKSTYTLTGTVPLAATGQTFVVLGGSGLSAEANTQVVFDNADLELLPEPTAVGVGGLTALLLLRRRSRKADEFTVTD